VRTWVCALAFSCLTFLISTGCDKKGADAQRVRVTGKVTLDGKDLQTGTVVFDPESGEPPAVMNILDGKYEGLAPVGKNRVRIAAIRKVSMKEKMGMDGPGYDQLVEENALPPRYGDKSEIFREVTEAGPNEFNFDTKSK
jgi:hypothetical protein